MLRIILPVLMLSLLGTMALTSCGSGGSGFTPAWAYQLVFQSPSPSIARGGSGRFELQMRNTGNQTWHRNSLSATPVNLGTSNPHDRISQFDRVDIVNNNASGWLKENRITMQEDSVAPGQTGTFVFYMSAPQNMTTGTYHESFQLVADGVSWFPVADVVWDIPVN